MVTGSGRYFRNEAEKPVNGKEKHKEPVRQKREQTEVWMVSCVLSGGIRGIESFMVRVEADISEGMPLFELVGYLGSEV